MPFQMPKRWKPRLLPALLLAFLTAAPGLAIPRIKTDWSAVQAVEPGKRITVLLYKDAAPAGSRKIKGLFSSATAETVTLLPANGRSRTLERRDVRKALVRRPLKKRIPGWIGLGIALFSTEYFLANLDAGDDTPEARAAAHALFTLPAAAAFFYGSRMVGIYNVPRKHRSP